MTVSLKEGEKLKRTLTVSLTADVIDKKTMENLKKLNSQIKINGFRPGKIPENILKQRYGASTREEAINNLVRDEYVNFLKESKLAPAAWPTMDNINDPNNITTFGKDFSCDLNFEIFPEIEVLPDYSSYQIEKLTSDITAADVDREILNLRKHHATWHDLDREAKKDDKVIIDFTGTLNGEKFPGGSATDFEFIIGDGRMLPDFENHIQNTKKGDSFDFSMTFPADYFSTDMAGKEAQFHVDVKSVKEQQLPELDKEFLKKNGVDEENLAHGIDMLRTKVRQNMEKTAANITENKLKTAITEKLLEIHQFDCPEVLIQNEMNRVKQSYVNWCVQYMGQDPKDVKYPLSDEKYKENAEKQVRATLIISKIAETYDIKPTNEEIEEQVTKFATSTEQKQHMLTWLYDKKNEQHLHQIESMILEKKIMTTLESKFNVVEKHISYEELSDNAK